MDSSSESLKPVPLLSLQYRFLARSNRYALRHSTAGDSNPPTGSFLFQQMNEKLNSVRNSSDLNRLSVPCLNVQLLTFNFRPLIAFHPLDTRYPFTPLALICEGSLKAPLISHLTLYTTTLTRTRTNRRKTAPLNPFAIILTKK
jgi:hypothetical protein